MKLYNWFYCSILLVLFSQSTAQETLKANNDSIRISLSNFNDQKPYIKKHAFPSLKNMEINLSNISSDVAFILFQVHSYQYNLTMSYNAIQLFGSNTGLFIDTISIKNLRLFLKNDNVRDINGLLAIVLYNKYAPIPGGCNMEFDTEVAPYQKVLVDNATITVDAQPGSVPRQSGHKQDCHNNSVKHEAYRLYLPEQDLSQESYFNAIESMLTVKNITHNGDLISPSPSISPMRRVYSAYHGTGSVYVMIAMYNNYSAAYVPTFSYGCSPLLYPETCQVLNDTFSQVLCAMIFFLGVFSVFLGHRFFRLDMFLTAYFIGSIFVYTICKASANLDVSTNIGISLGVGSVIGFLTLIIWHCQRKWVFHNLVARISLGVFFASIWYFSISDSQWFTENNATFWLIYSTIILSVMILTFPLGRFSRTITTAIFGAYMMIVPIDYYAGTSLKYIVINVIRRVSVSNFNVAVIVPPFEIKDKSLVVFWAFLIFLRVFKHYYQFYTRRQRREYSFLG